ncbi:serine/threonine-protein kinase [Myxococcus sp. AB025B]|uniref:serine/threonine-protein kinase n=1 Tax=Myxococcus sp. AB025B TaxID=2562794 RepID=UPI001E65C4B5|nr:serine/threonine-protein kinase [Myxococcus sp. AB025B]
MPLHGMQWGRYVIDSLVAVGGSSDVYRARALDGDGWVAVKTLSQSASLQAELVARFQNEAEALLSLRHPYLVEALEMGTPTEDGPPFLVLEWLPVSLHELLARRGGRLSLEEGVQVLRQLAQVLHFLHEKGVIHRDLKPENVLMACSGPAALEVRLTDLGLARLVPGEGARAPSLYVSTAREALLGTGEYMAPEQWTSPKGVDAKVDVYALGVLGFRLLVGAPPFSASERSGLFFLHALKPPPLALLEGLAPEPLRVLLGAMLAKKPGQRPEMVDVARTLDSLARD